MARSPHDDTAQDEHAGRRRLTTLTAIDAALHRRDEVSAVIADAVDRDDAVTTVSQLLGVHRVAVNAVLTLTWDRMTVAGVRAVADGLSHLTEQLGIVVPLHTVWTAPETFDHLEF